MGKNADGSIIIQTLGDLIDYGYGLSFYCDNRPECGRALGCDVYDLAERFGRETVYVRNSFRLKCAKCGSRDISGIVTTETRQDWQVKADGPDNMRPSRTPEERAKALSMIAAEYRANFGLE